LSNRGPLAVAFIAGMLMIGDYFLDWGPLNSYAEWVQKYYIIIAAFAIVLGVASLFKLHLGKLKRKEDGWRYSIVTFFGFFAMIVTGLFMTSGDLTGTKHPWNAWLYTNVQLPLGATMFSLLAFFIASAAYRAFRARSLEATLLLLAACLVMLGQVPILTGGVFESLPEIKQWILDIPNMASKRAIMIGVGLGMMSTALKIIFGIERTYLGGSEE